MNNTYKLVIFAFLVLNLLGWISVVEGQYGIPVVIKYLLSISVLGIILYCRRVNPSSHISDDLIYPVILIFIIWSIILLIFGVLGFRNRLAIQLALADPMFFMPYLLPLILLYTRFDLSFFRYLFFYSSIVVILAVIAQLLVIVTGLSRDTWYEATNRIQIFNLCAPFLLLTAHIARKKYITYLVLAYYLLWIILWSFYGRRGALMNDLLFLLFMIMLRLRTTFLIINERIKIYLAILVAIVAVIASGSILTSTYVFERGFNSDAFEASRGGVFDAFFYDFRSTMDWIFGRGINGTVLRSFITNRQFYTIENGFLTIILKGGLFYTIPFVIILLRASYVGFFNSNNDIAKALASYILIYLIVMAAVNVPSFSTEYVFLWIAASSLFSSSFRRISNFQVYQALNTRIK